VTDDHSVELFTVAFDIDKTGDAKAKVGDSVTYTYTLTNGSSGNRSGADLHGDGLQHGARHGRVVWGPAVLPAAERRRRRRTPSRRRMPIRCSTR